MATVWPISNGRPKIRSGANTSPGRALVITCGVPSKPRSSCPIGWGAQCYLRHMVGDRSQRRRDVLETSTNLLHEGGWAALTMREVAARTGVSAGALYQWFDGKDEIYAELFTARLNRGIAQFDAMPDDLPFDDVLASMLRWVQTTWITLGRWQLDYSEIARGREPGPARSALSEAYRHILEVGSVKLQAAAEREDRRFLDDLDTMHMIWGIAAGVAQRAEVLQMETERVDQMMERAVRSLSAGLTESA